MNIRVIEWRVLLKNGTAVGPKFKCCVAHTAPVTTCFEVVVPESAEFVPTCIWGLLKKNCGVVWSYPTALDVLTASLLNVSVIRQLLSRWYLSHS